MPMGTAQLLLSAAEGGFSALAEDLVVTKPMRRRGTGRSLLAPIEARRWASPAMGPAVWNEIREMVALRPDCLLTSWCRALETDVDLAAGCGTGGVHISFPVSPILMRVMGKRQDWVLSRLAALIPPALLRFRMASVGAQDAFLAASDFLDTVVRSASPCGAHRVRQSGSAGLCHQTCS